MKRARWIAPLGVLLILFATNPVFAGIFGKKAESEPFDLDRVVASRDPELMLEGLDEKMRKRVEERYKDLVLEDSEVAVTRNKTDLYPNPILQSYVNRLGQALIPANASQTTLVSFRIVQDPLPFADALATGTVFLSTGLLSLLENESQLAFVLVHEAGHVVLSHHLQQIIEDEEAIKRGNRLRVFGAIAGAVLGAVAGKGDIGNAPAAAVVSGVGYAAGDLLSNSSRSLRNHRFLKEIQLESDQFALETLLPRAFDAREGPELMTKLGRIIRGSGAAADLAFGSAHDLPDRAAEMTAKLGTTYQSLVTRILDGEGFRLSSPRYNQLMAELKRDNGLLALERDLFAIARSNLEEAAAVRTDDPLTIYGLGMLYRTVGRTAEDRAKASSFLKAAMEFDEIRHRFPEAHLQYAVELLSREDPQFYPEIQRNLKNYVVLYQRKSGGTLPPEMRFVYDYLDLTGDRSWIAYDVKNVSPESPYQLTGDAGIDRTAPAAAKLPH